MGVRVDGSFHNQYGGQKKRWEESSGRKTETQHKGVRTQKKELNTPKGR